MTLKIKSGIALFLVVIVATILKAQEHHVYLIGDAGLTSVNSNGLKELIQQNFNDKVPATFVFLGDNIYEQGMPQPGEADRKKAEAILLAQIEAVKSFNANVFFLPGNHDWKKGKPEGLTRVIEQQRFIDSLKLTNINFFPKGGCPGPVEIPLNDNAVLIIIDSQWFLHPWDKPEGDDSPCEVKTAEGAMIELNDILARNSNKQCIVAAHHPVFTYGEHGGVFPFEAHLFPLREVNPKLFIPLPVIGSIYPLYRKIFGDIQDINHPLNRQYRDAIRETLKNFPGTIYASGHEHALEYIIDDSIHYIVSGSGVKNSLVRKKHHAKFVSSRNGFARLEISNRGTTARIFEVHTHREAYSATIVRKQPEVYNSTGGDDLKKTVTTQASHRYHASNFKTWMLGENYRAEWHQPITVPILRMQQLKGGLVPLQKGGGMQTLSLRLADSSGTEYTFRSIEKFPEKAVPEMLRGTFGADLVQDQISAAHPYAALVIPYLARAAHIYHTNPQVGLIADDPALKEYRDEFANTLVLFEDRPGGSAHGKPNFGNADKIISTDKVLERLLEDNDNKVDQSFVIRSRLFDLMIGDWDRHDDQWRWAVTRHKKSETYRPIPRDRDQAFFCSDGFLSKLYSRKWALPKLEGFHNNVHWTPGFMFNARYFDRSFLNDLEFESWNIEAANLQGWLSDSVIESSIKQFPEEIYRLHGDEIIRKIKARRNGLQHYAREHYEFLAREVDIPGSNRNEKFSAAICADGQVIVTVQKVNKKNIATDTIYHRKFFANETKEVRLYGLGGDDIFDFSGQGKTPIKIRVVGGDGMDSVKNKSDEPLFMYDQSGQIAGSGKIRSRVSADPSVNEYDRKGFHYQRLAPLLYGTFNYDDGLFVGGGFHFTNYGFRKKPFKSRHIFLASYAPLTGSYNFKHNATFNNVFGKVGVESLVDVKAPNFVNNFFGWGNESVYNNKIDENPAYGLERSIDYYRIRFQEVMVKLKLTRPIGGNGIIKAGPFYQRIEIEPPNTSGPRFIRDYAQATDARLFDNPKNFGGVAATLAVDKRDNQMLTKRGILFKEESTIAKGFDADATDFTQHEASIAFYQSFKIPSPVTYALRLGGGLNTGHYELYQAQVLDGKTELRGFRKTRFYGDQKVFLNNEVRIKLANFKTYLFPASFGMNAFYDVGRVWYKNSNGNDTSTTSGKSSLWHQGFGGGLWFTPFNFTVVGAEFAHSREGNMAYVRLGFLF